MESKYSTDLRQAKRRIKRNGNYAGACVHEVREDMADIAVSTSLGVDFYSFPLSNFSSRPNESDICSVRVLGGQLYAQPIDSNGIFRDPITNPEHIRELILPKIKSGWTIYEIDVLPPLSGDFDEKIGLEVLEKEVALGTLETRSPPIGTTLHEYRRKSFIKRCMEALARL